MRRFPEIFAERFGTGRAGADLAEANRDHRESARSKLKKLLLEKFRQVARPGDERYGKFYTVAKKVDNAMA